MYANVLKLLKWIPLENIGDQYFFLIRIITHFRVISPFNKITLRFHIFVLLLPSGQAVLESSSVRVRQCWGHSVLETPALVIYLVS